ncbi:MAG TPA: DNA polymerase/3'-5' exonuclease PolX [bacterium]|nr:DNA polymerase/3'-5' exonuclease PolX [bacterium]
MKNQEIADIFSTIADILEIQNENQFKVNAYRKAARALTDLNVDIEQLQQQDQLSSIPGVGKAIAKKIDQYLNTGKIQKYEELISEFPKGLLELLKIQNLGPKTIALAAKKLNVQNLDDLLVVIENGSLSKLPGMGEKKVQKIKAGVDYYLSSRGNILISQALTVAEEIVRHLAETSNPEDISIAGSIRRMKETVHDIDILVASKQPKSCIKNFVDFKGVREVIAAGETKASIRRTDGSQVDLRVVSPENFAAALLYFTGSKAHNVKLRSLAKNKSLKINEYGVFKNDRKIATDSEEDIYRKLGLSWIAPELREDRGEVELAEENRLPVLINREDILGDLHVHSNYSDGHHSIESMAESAAAMGYQYIAICDHSKSANYANGLSAEKLEQQIKEIDSLNQRFDNFKILKGAEVDILPDGALDFPDNLLQQLDIIVASIHSAFNQNPTERILTAMNNSYVDIIGHPTGRLINQRQGYDVDLAKVVEKAQQKGIALELNAHPLRLDLNDVDAKMAKDSGIKIAINTDAHATKDLNFIEFGIGVARRAWLEKNDVLNCQTCQKILNNKRKKQDTQNEMLEK